MSNVHKKVVDIKNKNMNMYKQIFLISIFCALQINLRAQKGNNAVSVNAETAIPIFQNDLGFGFILKGLYGIGKSGQLTLSGGVSKFNSKSTVGTAKITTRLTPILFGYKHNIRKFFIEPKIGLGEIGGKFPIDGDYSRPSVAAVFGGLSAGYAVKRINLGLSFLTAKGIENTAAGLWHNKSFSYTSIFIGYDLFSKSKLKSLSD